MRRRLRALLGCLTLALVALLPAGAARGELQGPASSQDSVDKLAAKGVRVLRSEAAGVLFEVSVPAVMQTQVETPAGTFDRLRIPGYGHLGQAGQPDLPQTSFWVALPPGAAPSLRLVGSESVALANVRALPGPTQAVRDVNWQDLSRPPAFETSFATDSQIYVKGTLFPAAPAELGEVGRLRDQAVVPVHIQPVQVNPAQRSAVAYTSLQIEVAFNVSDQAVGTGEPPAESAVFEAILADALLNYEQALGWRQPAAGTLLPSQVSPCMDANAFRLEVRQSGVYKLSHAELAAQGLPASVSSAGLLMCQGAQQIDIRVLDGGDGAFESGDTVVFYGQAIKTQETEANVYWLTYGAEGGDQHRMAVAADGPAGSTPASYSPTFHLEEDANYYSLIPFSDANDHWYWRAPLVGESDNPENTLSTTFVLEDKAAGSYSFDVAAQLAGWLVYELHKFDVRLNGVSVGQGEFSGSYLNNALYLHQASAPSSALQDGLNTLAIVALDNDANPDNIGHRMLVDWIDLRPRRQFVAQSDRLAFSQPAAGSYTFSASGFTSGATVEIYDVSDPAAPSYQTKQAVGGAISFSRSLASPADFSLTAAAARLSVESVVKDSLPSPLLSSAANQADYLIITDPGLNVALTPLRAQRASQGLAVKTVFVQDIFDEFSFGLYSTEAIKAFVAHTAENWAAPAPTYVLLAGEGSYDHRDVLGLNGPGGNSVPVYLRSAVDTNLGEAAADNQYVDVNGDDLADMLLGRLPARDPAELSAMVSKILAYENSPPGGLWRGRHLFVADNGYVPGAQGCNPDPAADFFAAVEAFLSAHFPAAQVLRKLYYAPSECYPNASYTEIEYYYAVTAGGLSGRLLDSYNEGNLFLVYTGHSGTQNWAAEALFDMKLAGLLANGGRTPILLPMTCLEGIYHFPQGDNLSEAQVKMAAAGAVASYAPTGLQVQSGHDYLLTGFYNGVFVDGDRILGEAVYKAKLHLHGGPNSFHDLHDTFMLLGDPALGISLLEEVSITHFPAGQYN
ncbi:MAG: C25 family cysteine peptidase [Candidatus Promineifilaceae bacterium]